MYTGSCIEHYLEKFVYPEIDPVYILAPTLTLALFTLFMYILRPPKGTQKSGS